MNPPAAPDPLTPVPPERGAAPPGRLRRLGPTSVLTLVSIFVPPLGMLLFVSHLNEVAEPLRHSGWGPLICVAVFTLVGGLSLLPTVVLSVFAGWAFGFATGYATALLGFAGAAYLGYRISRATAGRNVVEAVEADPRWRAVHRALLGGGWGRTFGIVALLRLPTVPPFGATTVALAALNVRAWPFLLGTVVGVMPRTAGYVWLAATTLKTFDPHAADSWAMPAVWTGVTVAVLAVVTVLARRALRTLTAE